MARIHSLHSKGVSLAVVIDRNKAFQESLPNLRKDSWSII